MLALAAILTLLGPLGAKWLGMRFGRAMPLCLSIIAMIIGALLLTQLPIPWMYAAGTAVLPPLGLFSAPYIMAILATLDSKGRAAAASSAFVGIGDTIGPSLGGFVLRGEGYQPLGWAASVLFGIALVLAYGVARRS